MAGKRRKVCYPNCFRALVTKRHKEAANTWITLFHQNKHEKKYKSFYMWTIPVAVCMTCFIVELSFIQQNNHQFNMKLLLILIISSALTVGGFCKVSKIELKKPFEQKKLSSKSCDLQTSFTNCEWVSEVIIRGKIYHFLKINYCRRKNRFAKSNRNRWIIETAPRKGSIG